MFLSPTLKMKEDKTTDTSLQQEIYSQTKDKKNELKVYSRAKERITVNAGNLKVRSRLRTQFKHE